MKYFSLFLDCVSVWMIGFFVFTDVQPDKWLVVVLLITTILHRINDRHTDKLLNRLVGE